MSEYGLPVLFALFVWWFSTGLIIFLDNLPRWTFRWTMPAVTALLGAALWRLNAATSEVSVAGAYASFAYGLLIWGWQEMAFLMGLLAGPRRSACPQGAVGWRRFRYGVEVVLWHELSILVGAAAVVALSWGGENQVGMWTYLLLWALRISAKLNLFLGVRNLNERFLPPHLAYLATYFRRRRMNALWPFSITLGTMLAAWLIQRAGGATSPFEGAAFTFLAAIVTLGVAEHWFMVLPLPFEALWSFALRRPRPGTLPLAVDLGETSCEPDDSSPLDVPAPGRTGLRLRFAHLSGAAP